jgi:GNAT superfamily N-acetyltransferase
MLPSPTPVADETLRISLHEGRRDELWPLFELAPDPVEAIRGYFHDGVVHIATLGGIPVGHSQVIALEGVHELRTLAVFPGHRRRGLGTRLVARAAAWVRDHGGDRLVTATASVDLDVLGFYQRLGFRVLRVERDAFDPVTGRPEGLVAQRIPVRDRLWLELELSPGES